MTYVYSIHIGSLESLKGVFAKNERGCMGYGGSLEITNAVPRAKLNKYLWQLAVDKI